MVARGMFVKESGRVCAVTSLPPTMRMSMPRMMYSVTTRLGTRPTATMKPLAIPQASPMPRPMANTTGTPIPGWWPNIEADTYADRPSTEPIDRSTFRLTTTMVSPSASSA